MGDKASNTGDSAPVDKRIGLAAMTGRQKGDVLGVRRTPAREHRQVLFMVRSGQKWANSFGNDKRKPRVFVGEGARITAGWSARAL